MTTGLDEIERCYRCMGWTTSCDESLAVVKNDIVVDLLTDYASYGTGCEVFRCEEFNS